MGNSRIQLRRGTSQFWEDENPTLFPGEPGIEQNPGHPAKLKIGDGKTPWRELDYSPTGGSDVPVDQASLAEHIAALQPHPVYDDGPSLLLLYQNAKV
jgi:hypothetical protein